MSAPQDAAPAAQDQGRTAGQVAKDIVLFVAAPFITLAWLASFPFIAAMMLTRRGDQYWRRWPSAD